MQSDTFAFDEKNTLPLISSQRRFWYDYQRSPLAGGKNILLRTLRFAKGTARERLNQIITQVFNRHQLLRAELVNHDGGWPQWRIYPEISVVISWQEQPALTLPVTPDNAPAHSGRGFDLPHKRPWRLQGVSTPEADYLIFAFHHIICDEFSVQIVIKEIDEALSCLSGTTMADDFANSAALIASEQQLQLDEGGLAFWQKTLSGAPTALNMPVEGSDSKTHQAVLRSKAQISGQSLDTLHRYAAGQKITFPIIIAAAYAAVLSLYSHDNEVVLGLPVSLRPVAQAQTAVGPFLNILPLRCELSAGVTFNSLCQALHQRFLSALDFSAIPFEEIVRVASQEKLAGRHPLFQTTYSFHDLREAGLVTLKNCRQEESWSGSLSCELSLTGELSNDTLEIFIDGDSRLFKAAFIERLAQHVAWATEQLVSLPRERLDTLSLLPPKQQALLLKRRSGIDRRQPTPAVLPAILESISASPESVAISGQVELTYAALMEEASRFAHALHGAGVKYGEFVLVGIEDDGHPVSEILGIILSGAAWVPVNRHWPQRQIAQVAAKTAARFYLGASLALENVRHLQKSAEMSERVTVLTPQPLSPVYAISTSGTTGEPKVAAIPWRGIANRFAWMSQMYGEGTPVTLKTTPWIYDSSVWQLLWPLTSGGRSVLPSRNELFDPVALAGLIEKEQVTVIDFVPSVLSALLPALENSSSLRRKLRSLRWVIIGAESLPIATAKRVKALLPDAKIINAYGPTEASIGCVYQTIELPLARNVPIGNPIPNVYVAVVDKQQRPVPAGAPGELILMGDCVGLGYLGTEDQKGFITLQLSAELSGAAYKTGDWVRWNEEGQLEFIARQDRQVKLRGVRLELSAIEAQIDEFAGVSASHALIATQENGKDTLVAFIKPFSPDTFDTAALTRALRNALPAFAVPEQMIVVDAFPLALSGKIDNKALNALFHQHQRQKLSTQASENIRPVEQIWRRILETDEPLDAEMNFFDAGGHSLLLLDLQKALNGHFNTHLSVVDLFNYPTIADQEALLNNILPANRALSGSGEQLS